MRLPCQKKELADRAEHAKFFAPCEHTSIGGLARLLQRWRQGWQGACIVIPLVSHPCARLERIESRSPETMQDRLRFLLRELYFLVVRVESCVRNHFNELHHSP